MPGNQFSPWPSFSEEEVQAVVKVLNSNRVNYWTGTICREFEKDFACWVDTKYAVALANGSVALEVALRALGIGVGDEVVVTSRTFIASASSIVTTGAIPVFADVDPDSQNISAETIEAVLTTRTRAVVCVHLAGWPCEMDAIMALANDYGLSVIEDCAQAHGARYRGSSVGAIGHAGAWSFCQDKIMTTGGEGGMLTTQDEMVWSKAWSHKDHGKNYDAVYNRQHPPGFQWLHESFGTNMRMTEMQGAIGRIQIQKMPEWHAARKSSAEKILAICDEFPSSLRVPRPPTHVEHAWYKCYVFVRPKGLKTGWDRDRIINEIGACGVPCFSGSCSEVYLEKAFEGSGFRPKKRLPVARELGETSLMFLVHPSLSKTEIEKTCFVIRHVMSAAAG